jgi:penicillin G amidase
MLIRKLFVILLASGFTLFLPACGPSSDDDDSVDDDDSSPDDDDDDDDSAGDDDDSSVGRGVTIYRGAYGTPEVFAATDDDAMYGLGWATATDRLFQANLGVLAGQGRLAEVLGDVALGGTDTIAHDKWMRSRGMWRHAQSAAAALDSTTATLLQAFSDGMNDRVAQHPEAINPLFASLEVEPQTWSPAHCLLAWYRLGDYFGGSPKNEPRRLHEFEADVASMGEEAAIAAWLALEHVGDPAAAIVQEDDVPIDERSATLAYAESMGFGGGRDTGPAGGVGGTGHAMFSREDGPKFSHAWAVSGARTTTGSAVMIADPQTVVTMPAVWYEFAVSGDSFAVRGVGIAGSPAIVIGYNSGIAWGLTATGLDQSDVFRLEWDSQMPAQTHYLYDRQSLEVEVQAEEILVRGGDPIPFEWKNTVLGPIVTESLNGVAAGEAYALRALPMSDSAPDTIVGQFAMMRATNIAELREAIAGWRFPAVNLVAGDSAGDVFYSLVGAVPIRSLVSPLGGVVAQEGRTSATEWQDIIPSEHLPHVTNPSLGYVYSANHRPMGAWYPLPLGLGSNSRGDTSRSRRLGELLGALPNPVEPEQVLADVQGDCVNPSKRDLVALATHVESSGGTGLSADALLTLDVLGPWAASGGSLTTGSAEAALAFHVGTQFRPSTAGEVLHSAYGGSDNGLNLFLKTLNEEVANDPRAVLSAEARAYLDWSLSKAWDEIGSTDSSQWADDFAVTRASPLIEYFEQLGGILSLDPSVTYQVAPLPCADGGTVQSNLGQSYTHWVDLAAVDSARSVLPPGGDEVIGANSTDQAALWETSALKPAPLSESEVAALAVTTEEL